MLSTYIKYYCVSALVILLPGFSLAQGTGRAILNESFGEGAVNPGLELPAGRTSFTYTTDSCTRAGEYTITNSLYRCPRTRMGRSIDNTAQSHSGYMMLLNGLPANTSKLVYVDTLTEALCPGTVYQFSAWILNTGIPSYCNVPNPYLPNVTLSVETLSGQVLQSSNTGAMNYDYDFVHTPKFHFYHADFTLPPGTGPLVLKIRDEASGFPVCPYSYAIDDIQFTTAGPEVKVEFDGALGPVLVKSVCFSDNKTISMSGLAENYYNDTRLQWQLTNNEGLTWSDIPGATTGAYNRSFAVADTFLFRLTAAEGANIANQNCRVVSNNLRIQVDGIPTGYSITNNSPVCSGSDLIFNGEGGAAYEWHGPNGFHDNIPFPHIFYSTLADSGWYYADVITLGGCRGSDSTYARVIGTDVHAGPDTSICKGHTVQLNSSAGATYEWSPPQGLSGIAEKNPESTPAVTTTYTVRVTDGYGCSDTAKLTVRVKNSVAVKAIVNGSAYLCRPYDSAFFSNGSTGNLISWKWNFGNGQIIDSSEAPRQYYSIPIDEDSYLVTLSIADSAGCTDTAYRQLRAVSNCYIAVPSAFSPNGDGLNDYLHPLNAYKAINLLFRVYNRKGLLLFETNNWLNKWDGTYKGAPQDPGTYVWILQYDNELNKRILLKGTAVLLR